jgi:hypothetical protein
VTNGRPKIANDGASSTDSSWTSAYPAKYERLLLAHGMPPWVAPWADEFNKGLIHHFDAGCVEDDALRAAAEKLIDGIFADAPRDEDEPDCNDIGD